MEKQKKFGFNKANMVIVLFFLAFLFYGFWAVGDYNVSPDETIERITGLINFRELLQIEEETIGRVDFAALCPLGEWRDRYYGAVAQYIPLAIEKLFDFQLEFYQWVQIRHVFTFVIFWMACVCFFFLCRKLGCSKMEAFLGTVFLILSPRILAEAFYNIKDSVFLSMIVFNIYAAVLFLQNPNVLRGILLAVVSAICINVRILGAEIIALCMLFSMIRGVREKKHLSYWLWMACVCVLAVVFYVVITPVTWSGLFEAVQGILATFSNYTPWTGLNYYNGQSLYAWELPWHYLFVWIITTTPLLYLVLTVVGMFRFVKKLVHRSVCAEQGLIALYVVIPLIYVILRAPSLYNGWRHFYFIYPGLLLAAIFGWRQIYQSLNSMQVVAKGLVTLTGLYLCLIAGWIFQNHPFGNVYFNHVSRSYAAENLDKDYWLMAQQQALLWVAENDGRDHIKVHGGSLEYLPEDSVRERFEQTTWDKAEYIIYSNISNQVSERFDGYYLMGEKGEYNYGFDGFELYDEVHRIDVSGITVCTVYRRTHNKGEGASLRYQNGTWRYDMHGVFWNVTTVEGQTCLEAVLPEMHAPDRIGMQSNMGCLPVRIELSSDGQEWIIYEEMSWLQRERDRLQINLDSEAMQYIRLYFEEEKLKGFTEQALELRLGIYYRNMEPADWNDKVSGITTVSASHHYEAQIFAIDGNVETRWDSGVQQKPGISYEIELTELQSLAGITLDHGAYADDYPRKLVVYGSLDGQTWYEIPMKGKKYGYYECESRMTRFVRMELAETSEWNWSICEIKLWTTP